MADDEQQDQTDQREADDQDTPTTDDLGDKGKRALQAERDARQRAEKERNDLAKRITAFEQAQQARDDEAAKAKGEWETVAKNREDELAALKAQLAERDLRERKAVIAKQHGIPDELLDRLKGDTDDELEEDAKAIAKVLKTREAPENDAGERTPPGTKRTDKSKFADKAMWGLR